MNFRFRTALQRLAILSSLRTTPFPLSSSKRQTNPTSHVQDKGGFINPDMLRQSAEARDFVRAFDSANKPIATLCHGPWVLASAGILDGRVLTSWPGVRDDLVNAGATWIDNEVV